MHCILEVLYSPPWDCRGNWGILRYLDRGGGGAGTCIVYWRYCTVHPGIVEVTGESWDT